MTRLTTALIAVLATCAVADLTTPAAAQRLPPHPLLTMGTKMKKILCAAALAIVLTGPALAERLEYDCGPRESTWVAHGVSPRDRVRDTHMHVSYDDTSGWEIILTYADGHMGVKSTGPQADQDIDTSDATRLSWRERRNRSTPNDFLTGWLENGRANGAIYVEQFFIDNHPVEQWKAQCRPAARTAKAGPPPFPLSSRTPSSASVERLELDCGPLVATWETIISHPVKVTSLVIVHDTSFWSILYRYDDGHDGLMTTEAGPHAIGDTSDATHISWREDEHKLNKGALSWLESEVGWLESDNAGGAIYVEQWVGDRRPYVQWESCCRFVQTPLKAGSPPSSSSTSRPDDDSVTLYPDHDGRALYAYIDIGPWPQRVLLDTGATNLTVTEPLAQRLLAQGLAHAGPGATSTLADGSRHEGRTVVIDSVTIGSHVLRDVRAGVTPDGADMLLGLPLLNQIGRFTIDTGNHKLIFG